MKRHGVFYCRHCGYDCPVKAPVTDSQRDLGDLNVRFAELVGGLEGELRDWLSLL